MDSYERLHDDLEDDQHAGHEPARCEDFAAARGFECYVPALAQLRVEYWAGLSPQMRAILEVADYIGYDRTLQLTIQEFETLWTTLPGFIWRRAVDAFQLEEPGQADYLFSNEHGCHLTSHHAFNQIAQAMREPSA